MTQGFYRANASSTQVSFSYTKFLICNHAAFENFVVADMFVCKYRGSSLVSGFTVMPFVIEKNRQCSVINWVGFSDPIKLEKQSSKKKKNDKIGNCKAVLLFEQKQ